MDKKKKFLKSNEAADYLGVSRSSLTNWVKQGSLGGGVTPGGHFRFTLEELDKFAASRGMEPGGPASTAKILIIDDDQDFRDYAREALQVFANYELKEAEDGMKGALLLGAWRPDLVILDLRMPNMNGVEFCKSLRENYPDADVKVLVASAHLSDEVRTELTSLGVDIVLEKPVRLERFVAAAQQLAKLKIG